MHVKFTCVNEIEAMYERPRPSRRVSVKVETSSTFMLTRERPYVASKFTRVELRGSGNQLLRERRSSL